LYIFLDGFSTKMEPSMGGLGRDNWYRWEKKATVEEFCFIDVRCWQRDGSLEPGGSFGWQWMRNGETVVSIQFRYRRAIFACRHRYRLAYPSQREPPCFNW
jgi:hypothetical protein